MACLHFVSSQFTIQKWLAMCLPFICLSLLTLLTGGEALNPIHEVTQLLPGMTSEYPSRIFSGYLDNELTNESVHYVLVLSENSVDDPLIIWLQGGPGASSMLGLFTENGPLRFTSTGALETNPYSWSKVGHMLYIDSPPGVGFSYCKHGPCPVYNDTTTGEALRHALYQFFKLYPDLYDNGVIVAGESYGGIYVPILSHIFMEGFLPELKGVVVGNGCTGLTSEGGCGIDERFWVTDFLFNHGYMSTRFYNDLIEKCGKYMQNSTLEQPQECADMYLQQETSIGLFNIYNVYDRCYMRTKFIPSRNAAAYSDSLRGYPCEQENYFNKLMNDPEAKMALHVSKATFFQTDGNWDGYKMTLNNVGDFYREFINAGIKVLIYYGDFDSCVPINGGMHFYKNLGYNVTSPQRQWTVFGDDIAGLVEEIGDHLSFVSVHAAGHMVPTYAPEAALCMIHSFVTGKSLPELGKNKCNI